MTSGDIMAEAWGWHWKYELEKQRAEDKRLREEAEAKRRADGDYEEVLRNTRCSPYCLNGNYR